jgi:hypothetical protein
MLAQSLLPSPRTPVGDVQWKAEEDHRADSKLEYLQKAEDDILEILKLASYALTSMSTAIGDPSDRHVMRLEDNVGEFRDKVHVRAAPNM